MLLGIIELLERQGLDASVKTKLVRHQDPGRYDVHELRREGWLDFYQGFQRRPVFDGCDQIVSFLGAGQTKTRFLGVYQVQGHRSARRIKLPRNFPYPEWKADGRYFYDLSPVAGFESLQDRIVIEWGGGARAWVQNLRDKEVIEVAPEGRVRDPFTDYQEFVLSHDELVQMVRNPEANPEWRARLSAVAGIYLIQATTTGQQYVGSAHGTGGVWGRWKSYATNGHGGNALLKQLVTKQPNYPRAFRYTLLQVLPATTTRAEVLRWERIFKQKLGTRATGLNLN